MPRAKNIEGQRLCKTCGHSEGYHDPPVPRGYPYPRKGVCYGHNGWASARARTREIYGNTKKWLRFGSRWLRKHHPNATPFSLPPLCVCVCRKFIPKPPKKKKEGA